MITATAEITCELGNHTSSSQGTLEGALGITRSGTS